MKVDSRTTKKWRNDTPSKHRSYAEKRNRSVKHVNEEIRRMILSESKPKKFKEE